MQVSVLIVSYNVSARLRRCLSSVEQAAAALAPQDMEVVVVDNASPDDSAAMVRTAFSGVRLLAWQENRGFSAAVNAAAHTARGEVFLLLNPDTELPADGLPRMLRSLARLPKAAAVGFRQVDGQGHFQLAVGPRPTLLGELARRTVQRRLDSGSLATGWALDRWLSRPRPVPWVAGSSLLVHRSAFMAVGGFDPGFFLYFEDIDFCLRLGAQGHLVYYDPTVTLLHHRGLSAATTAEAAQRAYRASQVRFWGIHRGPWMRRLMQGYLWARGVG